MIAEEVQAKHLPAGQLNQRPGGLLKLEATASAAKLKAPKRDNAVVRVSPIVHHHPPLLKVAVDLLDPVPESIASAKRLGSKAADDLDVRMDLFFRHGPVT